jgi:hypothetical protein
MPVQQQVTWEGVSMKTISNTLKTILLSSLSLMLGCFVITPAFAVDSTGNPGEVKPQEATTVCARILKFSTSSKNTITSKQGELQTDFSKRLKDVSGNQSQVDTKVATFRTNATAKFEEKIKSLEAESGFTDVQKAAIETYKTSVQSAESTRKVAVDSARSAYRTGLATIIANQQQTLSTASTTYQSSIDTAFTTAVDSCTSSNGETVMATLKAAIKSARMTLDAARTPDATKAAIQQLAATRDASIKAANSAFHTTLTGLTATLKAALGVTATVSTSDNTTPAKP